MTAQDMHVAIVGAGVTGLVAARQLADAGARVTVLEASERVGGQLRSESHDGRIVDVGAEALYTAVPGLQELLDELDLGDDVVAARSGTTWIATPRGLRRLPAGMGPAGPTRLWPVATSRVLSPIGLLRAACEPLYPQIPLNDDMSVGRFLTRRFGGQVVDRLVDPLLGNLHAGDVHRLSLAAATPHLDQLARRHRSLVLARPPRAPGTPGTPGTPRAPEASGAPGAPRASRPGFVTVRGGLGRIADALESDPRIEVRTATPVRAIELDGGGYRVLGPGREAWHVDAVVMAAPAAVAARLLTPLDEAAADLAGIRTASVATAVVGYDLAAADELSGTGLLVPSTSSHLLKAATFLSAKWPHLTEGPTFLVRLSAGRADDRRIDDLDDTELVDRLHDDLAELTGLTHRPVSALVHRWRDTMPQLEVGHLKRIAHVRQRLTPSRIVLAGASYDGVGITNCVGSARRAVAHILQAACQTEAA